MGEGAKGRDGAGRRETGPADGSVAAFRIITCKENVAPTETRVLRVTPAAHTPDTPTSAATLLTAVLILHLFSLP